MNDLKKTIQKKIEEVWPDAQKNISKISHKTLKTLKKSEKQLLAIYDKTKKKTEQLILQAKREELYYELGKAMAPLLSSDQLKNKTILKIYSEIQEVNKQLRSKARS
ncbi:hypothetical protein BU251_03625 [Candidatus Velamenicoccus archaeovorus]|uniref:Uncharacterized protein n=1 Tax=Velamenicoccus archaeovorus TaxID=1930593 RepID=A0A410P3V8_VELA1|nr:hypothetical protein [Candidatus Velamenicoccus archaeovorus]QAT16885.1 hypothetical protein BU251_03625 [Candidatus Velamenicoccus archaeovorus]